MSSPPLDFSFLSPDKGGGGGSGGEDARRQQQGQQERPTQAPAAPSHASHHTAAAAPPASRPSDLVGGRGSAGASSLSAAGASSSSAAGGGGGGGAPHTSFLGAFGHVKQTSSYVPPPAPPANTAAQHAPPPQQQQRLANPKAIMVSRRQKGNPLLSFIKNVPWEYGDIVADYQMGSTSQTCALFLSVKYHLLKPRYVYSRMEQLQMGYKLRVLLCLVDSEECQKVLLDIHSATLINGWTMILAWSPEEAARYLETYQTYEHKQADTIQERVEGDYMSRLTDVLTTVRSINKTDVANLSTSLGSLASLMAVSKERLALCPGVGAKKVQRLHDAFTQPFQVRKKPRAEEGEGGGGASTSGANSGDVKGGDAAQEPEGKEG